MWQYNEHPDFKPYYDESRKCWAVSIQYLDVWYYKTEKEARADIPRLKEHRKNVLKEIDRLNKKYYEKIAFKAECLKKLLSERRKEERKWRLTKDLTFKEKEQINSMIDSGYDSLYISEKFNINLNSVGQIKWHKERKRNDNK